MFATKFIINLPLSHCKSHAHTLSWEESKSLDLFYCMCILVVYFAWEYARKTEQIEKKTVKYSLRDSMLWVETFFFISNEFKFTCGMCSSLLKAHKSQPDFIWFIWIWSKWYGKHLAHFIAFCILNFTLITFYCRWWNEWHFNIRFCLSLIFIRSHTFFVILSFNPNAGYKWFIIYYVDVSVKRNYYNICVYYALEDRVRNQGWRH